MNQVHTCYIAIGSNLSDPQAQAESAIFALHDHAAIELVSTSSLYSSRPMGPQDQPDYINAVVCVRTQLSPLELLDCTQEIEQIHGRERKAQRWGARTLDLDILLYDDLIMDSERLTIPHYGMKTREFVLYPLHEISPNLVFPDGST
ncbi:MAG: 2-amino-4-hydroxy-6-hydroxymethyldihydropteridine diphosphokinase, partial [Vibrio sp.]